MSNKKLFRSILVSILTLVILPVTAFAGGGTLAGKVVDYSVNAPVAGSVVTLKPHVYGYGTHDYTVTTDNKGQFIIGDIIPYVYTSGGAKTLIKYRIYVLPPGSFLARAEYIGGVISFQFEMIQKLTIPLSSIADSGELTGRVFDLGSNAGIAGAQVTVKPSAYGYGTKDYTATTGPNGDYVIRNIKRYVYSSGPLPKPVKYSITVSAPGYPEYTSEFISLYYQPMQERQVGLNK